MAFWFLDKPRSWGLLGIGFPVVNQCGETRSHRVLIGCVERGADSLSGLPAETMDRSYISRVGREHPAYRAEALKQGAGLRAPDPGQTAHDELGQEPRVSGFTRAQRQIAEAWQRCYEATGKAGFGTF
jgi:hypothetical protein